MGGCGLFKKQIKDLNPLWARIIATDTESEAAVAIIEAKIFVETVYFSLLKLLRFYFLKEDIVFLLLKKCSDPNQ